MKNEELNKIIEELRGAGASQNEAEELSLLSKNLSNLYKFERSGEKKVGFLKKVYPPRRTLFISRRVFLTSVFSVVLLLGFVSVVSAQGSFPGEPLYSVKRLSENVISYVNPSFKSEILKRRSEEINQLAGQKNSRDLQNTINDYSRELNQNQKLNVKKVEESKDNLEQASEKSSDGNKSEIENLIKQTENKQEDMRKQQGVKNEDNKILPISPEINKNTEQNQNVNGEQDRVQNTLGN